MDGPAAGAVFTKELEEALLEGSVDLLVRSTKSQYVCVDSTSVRIGSD